MPRSQLLGGATTQGQTFRIPASRAPGPRRAYSGSPPQRILRPALIVHCLRSGLGPGSSGKNSYRPSAKRPKLGRANSRPAPLKRPSSSKISAVPGSSRSRHVRPTVTRYDGPVVNFSSYRTATAAGRRLPAHRRPGHMTLSRAGRSFDESSPPRRLVWHTTPGGTTIVPPSTE